MVFSGSLDPKWSGSFTPTITYQRFTLSAMTAFYLGHYFRPNFNKWYYDSSYSYGNAAPKEYLAYWRASEEERKDMLGNGMVMNNSEMYWDDVYFSDRHIAKADYLKLRNIVLTYRFSHKICKKLGMEGCVCVRRSTM